MFDEEGKDSTFRCHLLDSIMMMLMMILMMMIMLMLMMMMLMMMMMMKWMFEEEEKESTFRWHLLDSSNVPYGDTATHLTLNCNAQCIVHCTMR